MLEELRVYRAYAGFIKCFLLISGMSADTARRYVAYRCLSFWSVLSCLISSLTAINTCTKIVTNITVFTRVLGPLVTAFNATVKGFCLVIYEKKLRLLNDTLDSLLDEISSKTRLGSTVFFFLYTFYRLIYFEAVLMGMTTTFFVMKPLLIKLLDDSSNTTKARYPLPTFGTFPWSVNSSFTWCLQYLFETNICCLIFSISTGIDGFFGFCMFRMSMILRVLGLQFEILSREKDIENRQKMFRDCIRQHVSLFRCRDIIQEIYGPIILLVTTTNAVCMCSLIFQVMQDTEISIGDAGMYLVYFSMKLIQTLTYAWPGCIVVSESESFRDKVYCSYWYENRDINFTKQFTLILIQRPIIITACSLFQVSLDLFTKVVNTAISYYFLLETIDGDK